MRELAREPERRRRGGAAKCDGLVVGSLSSPTTAFPPAWRSQRRPRTAVTKRVITCSMVANRITMSSDTDQFST